MKRNTVSGVQAARYANPNLVQDWQKKFQGFSQPEAPARKEPPKSKKPDAKAKRKPCAASVVINRSDSPKEFELVQFVLKAVSLSKEEERRTLTVLHVEGKRDGSRLVGSDGKRLHTAWVPLKIKSGEYRPTVSKDAIDFGKPVEGIVFPKWERVIPQTARKKGAINLASAGMGKDQKKTENLSKAYSDFMKQTGEGVNIRYLEDLPKREWDVYAQEGRQKPVVLKAGGTGREVIAVFVPLAA